MINSCRTSFTIRSVEGAEAVSLTGGWPNATEPSATINKTTNVARMIDFSLTIKAILTKTVPCVRKVHAVDKLNNRLTRIRDWHSPTFRYQHGIPAHAVVARTCTVRKQELRRLLSRVSASRLQYVQSSWIAPGALDKPSFELNASHASLPSCV